MLLLMFILGFFYFQNADECQEINRTIMDNLELDMFLDESMGEHLAWMNNLADQFLLNKSFTGELDTRQCDFGRWHVNFRSNDKRIMDIHAAIDAPHQRLHGAGKKIRDIYEAADIEMYDRILLAKSAHLQWMMNLRDIWQDEGRPFDKSIDLAKCAFGTWYYSCQTDDPLIKPIFERIEAPHEKLHKSALAILKLTDSSGLITGPAKRKEAGKIFNEQCRPVAAEVMEYFDQIQEIIQARVEKNFRARDIYVKEAQAAGKEVREKIYTAPLLRN